ncbi:hypothetical protein PAHAL_4G352900 [Panicum hallii]|jgi:hypothetical protein|uniref:Uncharacterized protein n=1 Tax=Panicum hallii TaxID=206008 RepID=A0A2S3HMF0_9POAL|nr:hypothetical protein PAHAL_4G352900 [Panicum hallii]
MLATTKGSSNLYAVIVELSAYLNITKPRGGGPHFFGIQMKPNQTNRRKLTRCRLERGNHDNRAYENGRCLEGHICGLSKIWSSNDTIQTTTILPILESLQRRVSEEGRRSCAIEPLLAGSMYSLSTIDRL